MKNIEKWKSFSCKECLLRKTCSDICYNYPQYDIALEHVTNNNLSQTCLSCGTKKDNRYSRVIIGCNKCTNKAYTQSLNNNGESPC